MERTIPIGTKELTRDLDAAFVEGAKGSEVELRDYFAAASINMVNEALRAYRQTATVEESAALCYKFADAMLAERKKAKP